MTIIGAAYGGFHVGRAIFASIEIEIRCAKFLRFEFNRRVAAAGVSELLACIDVAPQVSARCLIRRHDLDRAKRARKIRADYARPSHF
jgi:hypothetical protein